MEVVTLGVLARLVTTHDVPGTYARYWILDRWIILQTRYWIQDRWIILQTRYWIQDRWIILQDTGYRIDG